MPKGDCYSSGARPSLHEVRNRNIAVRAPSRERYLGKHRQTSFGHMNDCRRCRPGSKPKNMMYRSQRDKTDMRPRNLLANDISRRFDADSRFKTLDKAPCVCSYSWGDRWRFHELTPHPAFIANLMYFLRWSKTMCSTSINSILKGVTLPHHTPNIRLQQAKLAST